jgi:hypothetical protein
MESFIPSALNKASRDKDFDKIKTLGPYATALGLIIGWASEKRCIKHHGAEHIIFRGLGYTKKQM